MLAGGQAVAASAADAPGTAVTVDRTHPFGALPSDFVGLSYEMRELSTSCTNGACPGNFDARHGNLAALWRNLGPSNVRIAGNQLDRDTLWAPARGAPPNPVPARDADLRPPTDRHRRNGPPLAPARKA